MNKLLGFVLLFMMIGLFGPDPVSSSRGTARQCGTRYGNRLQTCTHLGAGCRCVRGYCHCDERRRRNAEDADEEERPSGE